MPSQGFKLTQRDGGLVLAFEGLPLRRWSPWARSPGRVCSWHAGPLWDPLEGSQVGFLEEGALRYSWVRGCCSEEGATGRSGEAGAESEHWGRSGV